MDRLEKPINEQRHVIEDFLNKPMEAMSQLCLQHWGHQATLDKSIQTFLVGHEDHRCQLVYVINHQGMQVSSNVTSNSLDGSLLGQNLIQRPYFQDLNQAQQSNLTLSDVYIDAQTHKPCITAIHRIMSGDKTLGFIAADFSLKSLPLKLMDDDQLHEWRQIKGDPSIRGTLFQQTRTHSLMDEHLDQVLDVVESLMTDQGIFHAKIHFSSSRATLWPFNDPYHYRLHVLDEIINPKVCLVYKEMPYPTEAIVDESKVGKVLQTFKLLREADETIYLRSASINIINGLVGLTFSCDGSHYMPVDEFLAKDMSFWFGQQSS